jgi:phytoene dehydrogenase-like protein
MTSLTIVGGGIGGLTAAIAAAEHGVGVTLYEAKDRLGGRAWTTDGDFKANWGPHVIYGDGAWWPWLKERGLGEPAFRFPRLPKTAFRVDGRGRRFPPVGLIGALGKVRRRRAPVDRSFQDWAADQVGDDHAHAISNFMGVATFDHDPGRFSARFVQERLVRATAPIPTVRYIPGGWGTLSERLGSHARSLGVRIELGATVDAVPDGPTILALPIERAAELLDDASLVPSGTRTALLDLGLEGNAPPLLASDFDEPGWIETYSRPDPTLAPPGHHLVQAQKGLRPGESLDEGIGRIEALLDATYRGWRDQEVWRRRSRVEHSTGALDMPGTTWQDRPQVDRGGGVYVVGDMVAAPGLLSEVSFSSALAAVAAFTASADSLSSRTPRLRLLEGAAADVPSAPAR